jgi:hypothetical protein
VKKQKKEEIERMKRTLMVSLMLVVLLAATTGAASAAWWLSLECPGDDGLHYEVVYHEDAGETFLCNNMQIHALDYDMLTWTATPNLPGGWMSFGAGDNGGDVYFHMTVFSTGNDFADGTLLGSFDSAVPGSLGFDYTNGGFLFAVDGVGQSGLVLNGGGNLAPIDGDPAWPVPEIITIVLVATGLIALGTYAWYRRRHNVALAAVA